MSFTVQPSASIKPGQTVTLEWLTENPIAVTIEPGFGKVTARGSRQVTPSATTEYTLTATGAGNTVLTKTVTVTVAGTTPVAKAAAPAPQASKETPKRPDGKPDFSGVYGAALGGGRGAPQAAAAPPVPGAIPTTPTLKPGAEKFKVVRAADDAGLYADCMPVVAPQAFSVPYQFQFAQTADHLIILYEYPGTFRIVNLNGAHPADPDPTWLGDSVGHWEGDTLVIDTIGFNDKTEINGYRHTEALHTVERLRRPSYDVVEYEAIIEDPNVFAGPWRVARRFGVRTDLSKIDEFVCEHNQDYTKLFGKQ
jgi:hypothetical protein